MAREGLDQVQGITPKEDSLPRMTRFFLIRQQEKGVQPANKPLASLKLIANMTQWELFLWQKQPCGRRTKEIFQAKYLDICPSATYKNLAGMHCLPFIATSLGQLELAKEVMSIDGFFLP